MADDVHKAQPHDLLLHRKRHGEEQFVVLCRRSAPQRPSASPRPGPRSAARSGCVEVDARRRRTICRSRIRSLASPSERSINRRRDDLLPPATPPPRCRCGTRFQVFFEQVFVPFELRFGVLHVGEHPLFAFEQLWCSCRRAPRLVIKIRSFCLARCGRPPSSFGMAQRGDVHDQSGSSRPACRRPRDDALFRCRRRRSFVRSCNASTGSFRGDAERYGDLRREGVHGQNVADAGRHDLVTQVFEREVGEVEIDAPRRTSRSCRAPLRRAPGDHGGVVSVTPFVVEACLAENSLVSRSMRPNCPSEAISVRFFWSIVTEIFYKIKEIVLFPQKIMYFAGSNHHKKG